MLYCFNCGHAIVTHEKESAVCLMPSCRCRSLAKSPRIKKYALGRRLVGPLYYAGMLFLFGIGFLGASISIMTSLDEYRRNLSIDESEAKDLAEISIAFFIGGLGLLGFNRLVNGHMFFPIRKRRGDRWKRAGIFERWF